jgi:hypothetical protein
MSSAAELVEELGRSWYKIAGAATSAYVLGGRLYLSSSGWLLLAVPNAFVHGLFGQAVCAKGRAERLHPL